MTTAHAEMLKRMSSDDGFIAALDQSGGSTPKALAAYGVTADAWSTEAEMYDRVHVRYPSTTTLAVLP